ncbi:hypothetical protein [Millionella massiliensis]|uniref:hypothetical protein n=1 Tax=Millionella massiliensis TaxID=1871023 RepID=UPI0024B686A7|nr:hypothetical protein [Millionella massiliensis]
MKNTLFPSVSICSLLLLLGACGQNPGQKTLESDYLSVTIDSKGCIRSLLDKDNKQEYAPEQYAAPLLSLYVGNDSAITPTSARFDDDLIILSYPGGKTARVEATENDTHIRFRLVELENRGDVDNIVWGPYHTTIREYIGDMIGVVSNDHYTLGLVAGDDNTTTGLPCDGDWSQMYYYVHSVDPEKQPLPDSLYEGQKFRIGGDGWSDVAFASRSEEFFYMSAGNGASFDPATNTSSFVMHARDRRRPQTIFFTLLPGFTGINEPRHHDVETIDVDFLPSTVALFGCPKDKTLKTIEQIVKTEGLPYVTQYGKWVRDPESFRADIAWWGPHDSLISYAKQLGIRAIQDEGMGEYYPNPADRWAGKKIRYGGEQIPIEAFTARSNPEGIAYGLHTLCEFLQPHCSDVSPVPSDSLCLVLRTRITDAIDATQTDNIRVADTSWLNEHGTWHCNKLNVLKLGKELLTYEGVTTTPPYTLTGVTRGAYNTQAQPHPAGETLGKLQMNCYNGFVPNMALQDAYADYYARLLTDGGMNYVDFDGQESFIYSGHGFYTMKRFYRLLMEKFREYGGKELRIMGSGVTYGNWLFMANSNTGGGNHVFNPVTNEWGIQGKDVRNINMNNFVPPTFGIQTFDPAWSLQTIENLQSKAIAWDAMYMLGLSEEAVEKCASKYELFRAFRTWEDARVACAFPQELKIEMREADKLYHLEQNDANSWTLYQVSPTGEYTNPRTLEAKYEAE